MSYVIEYPDFEQAKNSYPDFDFALLYMYSKIVLVKTGDLSDIDWNECTEARFFGKDAEMHIIAGEDPMAVLVQDSTAAADREDNSMIKKYRLGGVYQAMGQYLVVKQYTDLDEDGQTVIRLTRLAGIE